MSGFTTETYQFFASLGATPSAGTTVYIVGINADSNYLSFTSSPGTADASVTWNLAGNPNAGSYLGLTYNGEPIIDFAGSYYLLTDTDYSPGTPIVPDTNDTFTCYCGGTLILTERGEIPVEDLSIGEMVVTADGGRKPIRWIGHRSLRTQGGRYLFADPLLVNPIRIRAGALGDNLPRRDLCVSPEHAIRMGDILVQAGALVNDVSILREDRLPDVLTYYHIELADHALILAEGVAAETFVDNVNRLSFDNWAEHEALFGGVPSIEEMAYPRAQSYRQVPREMHAALMDRAQALLTDLAA